MKNISGWNIYRDGKCVYNVPTYKQAINWITLHKMHEKDSSKHIYDIRID